MEFLLGTAIIALPLKQQVPLLVGTSIWKWLRGRKKRAQEGAASRRAASNSGTTLEWAQLTCTLQDKEGGTRTLLDDLQGRALPGRRVAALLRHGGADQPRVQARILHHAMALGATALVGGWLLTGHAAARRLAGYWPFAGPAGRARPRCWAHCRGNCPRPRGCA